MKKIKQFVIDSSVIVKWLNTQSEKLLVQANKILQNAQNNKMEIVAPEIAKYEVGNALLYKEMKLPEYKAALAAFYAIPISFISFDEELAQETIAISDENNITYYDAAFLAVAEKLKTKLITANPKHQKLSRKIKTSVISLNDYK